MHAHLGNSGTSYIVKSMVKYPAVQLFPQSMDPSYRMLEMVYISVYQYHSLKPSDLLGKYQVLRCRCRNVEYTSKQLRRTARSPFLFHAYVRSSSLNIHSPDYRTSPHVQYILWFVYTPISSILYIESVSMVDTCHVFPPREPARNYSLATLVVQECSTCP